MTYVTTIKDWDQTPLMISSISRGRLDPTCDDNVAFRLLTRSRRQQRKFLFLVLFYFILFWFICLWFTC